MSATAIAPAGEKAGLKEWIGLAVLALPTLLVSIDVSVIILALPHIGASIGADSTQQLWIMDIYGFMLAGLMVTMGTLGDRIGRRKLLLIGGAGFAAASVLAAFAPTPELLILARGLLGVAGATLSPSMMALITNMFRQEAERGLAISIWLTCFMGGMTLGPLVGGFMLEHFWWGSVFLLGVPIMVLLLIAGPLLLPEFRDEKASRIDLFSVVLSLATILPIIYGLKEIAKAGPDVVSLAAIGFGIVVGIVFAKRQRQLTDPLLDLKLFGNPMFSTAVAGMFLITVTGALMLFINQYLQLVLGLSPLVTGLWTIPGVLGSVVGFMVAPIVARHVRPAYLISGGLLISLVGVGLVVSVEVTAGLAALVAGFAIWNLGCGPMVTLASGIVLSSVPPEKAGSAAATQETCSEFGFAIGIAALGSIGTAIYRGGVAGNIPAGLPADAAATAGDTLAGAVAVAQALPAEIGEPLLEAARTAFVGGVHTVAAICGVILLLVAIVTFTIFRRLPPLGAGQKTDENVEGGADYAAGT